MNQIEIREAGPCDAEVIAEIHLTARREAMPYLYRPHTDDEMRDYFARVVGDRPSAWWIARVEDQIVGFMLIDGEDIDHLYVRPGWQRRGIGLSLLNRAKVEIFDRFYPYPQPAGEGTRWLPVGGFGSCKRCEHFYCIGKIARANTQAVE
jgi:ribosomal protein S18 acetylase RimI-like enzyme